MKNESLPMNQEKRVVDRQFLERLGAKNCSGEMQHCTSSMETNVTDLSIWNSSFTSDQMINWTKCRYDTTTKYE